MCSSDLAENCVEHHLGVFEQQCLGDVDAKLAQRVELLFGGTVQTTGVDASNRCQASPAVEMAGGREAVAGVVADAARDDGTSLAEPCQLPPRSFHQPVDRDAETLMGERVRGFDLSATKCW